MISLIKIKENKEMKTIKYIAASLAIIAAASCQKEQTPEQAQERTITFTASFEQPDTKVILGEKIQDSNEYPVLWETDDCFTVFDDAKENKKFYIPKNTVNSPSQMVIFEGTGTFTDGTEYIAVYPYNSNHELNDDGSITYKCNGTLNQKSDANGLPNDKNGYTLASAIAKSTLNKESASVSFNHLFALIKFKVNSDNITKVRVKNLNESDFISINSGNLTIENQVITSANRNYIDLTPEGTYFTTNKYYYIAVLPTENFRLEFKIWANGSEAASKQSTKDSKIEAGQIINIGTWSETGLVQ